MEYSSEVKIYRRRKPQGTSLWKLFDHYFLEFEERYDDLFQQQYGFFRPVISHVVRKYLECGDLREGFARIKCPDCHHEFILAFSCRGRWFCPSCHNKKVVQFGHHLKETVLYKILFLQPQTAGQAQSMCRKKSDEILPVYPWQENRYSGSRRGHTDLR